jgi:hypothetical protein
MDPIAPDLLTAGIKIPLANHTLDLGREGLLDGDGRVIELRPQAYQVLRHLAVHAGRLVSKEELLAAVWPNLIVTDDSQHRTGAGPQSSAPDVSAGLLCGGFVGGPSPRRSHSRRWSASPRRPRRG